MGKPVEKARCEICGRQFSSKPKKSGDGKKYIVNRLCNKCRRREWIGKGQSRKEIIKVMPDVNVKEEVDTLVYAERRHPKLVERLRKKNEK